MFTKSAKYEVSVYRPGGEVNSTIYCSDIVRYNVLDISLVESRNQNPG